MILKEKLSDYTEHEFLALIQEIDRVNEDEPDLILRPLLLHFNMITEHPAGWDLLYRPASKKEGEPEEALRVVKEMATSKRQRRIQKNLILQPTSHPTSAGCLQKSPTA